MRRWLENIVRCVGDFWAELAVLRLELDDYRYLIRSVDS
jgi:hypothetical protein